MTKSAYEYMIQAFNHTEVGWIGIKSGGPNSTDYYYQSDEQTLITKDIEEKWEPNQPDNPEKHFCIHILQNTMRDRPCFMKYPYVCQASHGSNNIFTMHGKLFLIEKVSRTQSDAQAYCQSLHYGNAGSQKLFEPQSK